VVDLVLEAPREKAIAVERVRKAGRVLEFCRNRLRPGDRAPDLGERKASLLDGLRRRLPGNGHLRIHYDHGHEQFERGLRTVELPVKLGLRAAQVYHAKLQGMAHLLRGKPDSMGGVHGLDHGVGKRSQAVIENGDFLAFPAQNWIVVVNNFQGHRSVEFTERDRPP